ncbi:hypothetical protein GCM10017744_097030 [Streptomyces antimycoticus]|uniref:HTH luxR-type domain-containing protein n=1 Tax=Streptomyces antimycoticus TaxID=68175 RepID=A0A4D4K077_9ACTN|nr:response regulator transcription factor [Streptomyces antimycoticus]GDY40038.1 hypothetical protein SANT12839_009200 [Streptomyces antimycoticus]
MDLTAAVDVIRAPLGEILPRLSDALSEAIPHRALAELSGNCPHSPFKTHGHPPGDPGSAITTVEMAALAPSARAEGSRQAVLGGRLEVDAVPEWGTMVTATVPLGPPQPVRKDPLYVLGARELEVLEELARGRRNRQIAQELRISESTVKFHVANILEKLGVTSRGEAACWPIRGGRPDPEPPVTVRTPRATSADKPRARDVSWLRDGERSVS